ncbi:MAG TPA: sigma-70 family RNA polymerase sigma factor [Verrucomicrobiae bacterium]|nr:sigma-70 family RNA polymerase sigma factor [Verrucomicrobiae bacterium]
MKFDVLSDGKAMDDARLVELGVAGNRDAFGELVARYQSPVCALAYSTCGDISQSQDVAQEAFIIAWKKLGDLKEPPKFKSWLFGIARNLINGAFRKQLRNPLAGAESLDENLKMPGTVSNPAGQAISKEEERILWRSLEQVPETYREPLVLFYREHQSIEEVAATLDLTQEAARQRLSRGRKLLQEQVLAFVEGALERTNPGQAFTLGVLAALPAMTISAKAATLGAAAKGGATVTGAGIIGWLGAVLCPLLAFLNLFRVWRLSHKAARSDRERKIYMIFFPVLAGSIVAVILLTSLLMSRGDPLIKTSPSLFASLMAGLILGYPLLLLPLCIWFYRSVKQLGLAMPATEVATRPKNSFWEYRSRFELFGLPFIHLRTGGWQSGRPVKELKPVKAWIAADDAFAFGVLFAYGSVAVAPVSIGACSIGLFSYGAMSVGVLAVGGFGFGIWAFAGFGFGWQVSAGCAIAWNIASGGQYAIAHQFALGPVAHAAQVNNELVRHLVRSNPFFQGCWMILPYFSWLMWMWAVPMMISAMVQWRVLANRRRLDKLSAKPT